WSPNLNGAVVAGHAFEIGDPIRIAATGTSDSAGSGSWTVGPVPSAGSGLTVHFEVAARSAAGDLYDSNVVTLVIQ
ncbi:MAG TPA: hypothetical protein VGC54_09185, partial [Planctomycetota bacterium]